MADYFLSDLVESTALVNTDLLHIRTIGNIDKKVQFINLVKTFRDILNKDADYTIVDTDRNPIILVDSTTGNKTITLPTLAVNQNKMVWIVKLVAANNVILDGEGAETINGVANYTLVNQYEMLKVIATSGNWNIDGKGLIRAVDIDFGIAAGDVDADIIPLGTAVTSSPTGGTATNLANSTFVRAAIQEAFNRLINLSGVQNDAVDSRHYAANSIDEEHVNWGTGVGQIGLLKGHAAIMLTNYTGTGVPQIAALGSCEINGQLYTNPPAITITGVTANNTWYDILLTPSGTTYTASYIARGTGVWSDSKQGLYSGNNRIIGCVRRRASSSDFINKNILIVRNRTVQVKMEIGDWNMTADDFIFIAHGLAGLWKGIRNCGITIRRDDDSLYYPSPIDAGTGHIGVAVDVVDSTTITLDRIAPFTGVNFDATSYNRGWLIIDYQV